jgi:hypothetical protein
MLSVNTFFFFYVKISKLEPYEKSGFGCVCMYVHACMGVWGGNHMEKWMVTYTIKTKSCLHIESTNYKVA